MSPIICLGSRPTYGVLVVLLISFYAMEASASIHSTLVGGLPSSSLHSETNENFMLPITGDDQDNDGISDADEGLVCRPVRVFPEVNVQRQGNRCGSSADTFVNYSTSTNYIHFGGSCDGAWRDALDIQLNNLIPGVPVTFNLSISTVHFGNPKKMYATITGFGGLPHNVDSGGGNASGGGNVTRTFTPTGTTATGRMDIWIEGVNGFGGDIFVTFRNFQQLITPDSTNPIVSGSSSITCDSVDTDGDTIPDYLDLDSDNDGILDSEESNLDADGDGIGNWRDLDSDNDGISDLIEGGTDISVFDTDLNGHIDGAPFEDADRDGIADALETLYGEDNTITTLDTDNNGIKDYLDLDSDGDGIPDTIEAFLTIGYVGNDGDVRDDDADGDGIIDLFDLNDTGTRDFGGNFSPPVDTDAVLSAPDGVPDYRDLNSDNDALEDAQEGGATVSNVSYADPNGTVDLPENDLPDTLVSTAEVDYRESCAPEVDALPDTIICEGEGFVLPVLTHGNYFTETNGGGDALLAGHRITDGQTIYIFAEDPDFDCSSETSFQITVNRFTQVGSIGNDQTICEGSVPSMLQSLVATTATGTLSYQWQESIDGSTFIDIPGAIDEGFAPTTLTEDRWFRRRETTILNGTSCSVLTNTVKINVNRFTQLGAIEGDETLCYGATPNEITELLPTQAFGTVTHQWEQSVDGAVFEEIAGATEVSYAPAALTADRWYRRRDMTILNGVSCTHLTNRVHMTVLDEMELPEPMVTVLGCDSGTNTNGVRVAIDPSLIIGGSGNVAVIRFYTDHGTPDPSDDELLQSGNGTSYTTSSFQAQSITIEVEDSLGCTATVSTHLEERVPLSATATADQGVCIYDGTGRITLAIAGGLAPYFTAIDRGSGLSYEQDRLLFDGLDSGTEYEIHIRDSNNCTLALPVAIEAPIDLGFTMDISYNCETGTADVLNRVDFIVDPDLVPNAIFDISGPITSSSLDPSFTNLPAGDYVASIAYENGCMSRSVEFTVRDVPALSMQVDTQEVNTVTVMGSGGFGGYEYRFGNGAYGTEDTFTITASGTYTIYVRDRLGCEVSQEVHLEFTPVTIPNYFTPNGDGTNDGWTPRNLEPYPEAITEVYDRYGRHITTLQSLEKWDGIYEGMPLPSGDYWYVINLNDPNGILLDPIVGNFTLYR